MRDQRGAFVRRGRAARRRHRRRNHHQAAVRHLLELVAQQRDLLAAAVGVRHQRGSGLVVALDRVPAEVDARREHQAVVGKHLAVGELHAAGVRIDRGNEPRGWRGDVAQVRLDTRRMEALGWKAKMSSGEAVKRAIRETVAQLA